MSLTQFLLLNLSRIRFVVVTCSCPPNQTCGKRTKDLHCAGKKLSGYRGLGRRDFTAQRIGTVRAGPVSYFREEIAERQATPDLREPDPGFRRIILQALLCGRGRFPIAIGLPRCRDRVGPGR